MQHTWAARAYSRQAAIHVILEGSFAFSVDSVVNPKLTDAILRGEFSVKAKALTLPSIPSLMHQAVADYC